jgi:hypothetical protein
MLDRIIPQNDEKRKWFSILVTTVIAGLLAALGIYGIGQYGIALFILTPLFIGASSTMLYSHHKPATWRQSWQIGFLTLAFFAVGLIICAMEGVICIVMAAPFGFLLTLAGSAIGFALVKKRPSGTPTALLILIGSIPLTAFVEKGGEPELSSVVTSIEINADAETVWKNVIAFPQLDEPEEFIFKAGIAYPINAKIEGSGVGAVRHCNFTTGSFVEPLTVWDEPKLLKFDVVEQPAPMKEISFWDVNAPHLHDYFVSKQGQFKLTQLPNGHTLLEGTTWYYHNIRPAFYWQLWSDNIIHKIHDRVLQHIKKNAEAKK